MKKVLHTRRALYFDFTPLVVYKGRKYSLKELGISSSTSLVELYKMGVSIGVTSE